MLQFKVNSKNQMRSPCDHNCKWVYKVLKRTLSTVTFEDEDGSVKTFRISKKASAWDDCETIYPLGKYSMCPLLRACNNAE